MKIHTNNFKQQIKLIGKEIDSKITFGDTVLGSGELNAVTPSYQGAILKSVMKQLEIDSNVFIPLGTNLTYEFGLKVNGEYEYINFGNYIVYNAEKQEDTGSYKILCYDKMLFSMKNYVKMPITYPITIKNYINSLCQFLGLTFANNNDNFVNADKEIPYELYLDTEGNDIGYTFRDVFDELAQVTASTICINNNDELEVRYITETGDTIDEEYLKDVNVNFGEKYGKINSIVLSRGGGNDNIYLRDEESVTENGLCELKIIDNQIMNFDNRDEFLPQILNELNGLEFYLNDFASTGICYYDLCDRYNIKIGDNTYSCIMFNDEILVTQGLQENIYTEKLEESETDYTKADKTDRKINKVSLIVDKQEQEIRSLATKVVDVSNTVKGVGSIALENAYEGLLHKLTIKGNISLFYPQIIYPSNDLYPQKMKLKVDEEFYDLDLNYLAYINDEIADEFICEEGKCKIIRRVGIDGEGIYYPLENEIVEEKEDLFINVKKDSIISLLNYPNTILTAEYLLENKYTNIFASEVELNSQIKQTAEEINLKVSKNDLISEINQSADTIELIANRLIINSEYFKLDKDGKITSIGGTIGGYTIDKNELKVYVKDPYIYTDVDLEKMQAIIQNEENPSQLELDMYDINGDGYITSDDYIAVSRKVRGYSPTEGEFKITNQNTRNIIQTTGNATNVDNSSEKTTQIGLERIETKFLNAYSLHVDSNINCETLTQTSKIEMKKNIEKFENGLDIVKQTDIYKYHMKKQDDNEKKHIGFIIGNDYNYSKKITSRDNDGADIYSMVSVLWQAVKEQQEEIEKLKEMINNGL